ncbi:MAG TPA: M14 family zinc carboxypeptidase [Planctomycetota bacterium]|nr:M14 family zinc carboxypeptidase [Planctomycetota bacterium]
MSRRTLILFINVLLCATVCAGDATPAPTPNLYKTPAIFIDTFYENASPLRWDLRDNDVVELEMSHDHERFKPNQQLTHWNFKVHATKEKIGSTITFKVANVEGRWNGMPSPTFGRYNLAVSVSSNGTDWKTIETENLKDERYGLQFKVKLESECTQIARIVPYTDSDLQQLIKRIRNHPDVRVYYIGATAEGRPLEMIEIGNPASENQICLRARAHPWESGGSWLVDGLLNFLTSDNTEAAEIRKSVCFCIMPMANKDGVYRGMTRFTTRGWDLNRNWFPEKPIDPVLAPESACLQNWFSERLRQKRLPKLYIDIHNDNTGGLHLSSPSKDADAYLARMEKLEKLLREMTFFREGSKGKKQGFTNSGSSGSGIQEIYGIDGLVWELREQFADGLGRPPLHTDWQQLGANFSKVARAFFAAP